MMRVLKGIGEVIGVAAYFLLMLVMGAVVLVLAVVERLRRPKPARRPSR